MHLEMSRLLINYSFDWNHFKSAKYEYIICPSRAFNFVYISLTFTEVLQLLFGHKDRLNDHNFLQAEGVKMRAYFSSNFVLRFQMATPSDLKGNLWWGISKAQRQYFATRKTKKPGSNGWKQRDITKIRNSWPFHREPKYCQFNQRVSKQTRSTDQEIKNRKSLAQIKLSKDFIPKTSRFADMARKITIYPESKETLRKTT